VQRDRSVGSCWALFSDVNVGVDTSTEQVVQVGIKGISFINGCVPVECSGGDALRVQDF